MIGFDGLTALVRDAEQTCEALACERHGHAWESDGARACPRGCSWSQSAYRCRRCGEQDYGDPGGPGHADCYSGRCCDGTTEAERAAEEAAEEELRTARARLAGESA